MKRKKEVSSFDLLPNLNLNSRGKLEGNPNILPTHLISEEEDADFQQAMEGGDYSGGLESLNAELSSFMYRI